MDSDTEIFEMDDLGNRDGNQTLRDEGTVHFAVDTQTNRYTSIDSADLDYDDTGNLTTDKRGYAYTYDAENRIRTITDANDVLVATFDYDTQGRRIRVYDAVAETATLYYYSDNWQVLAEYDAVGTQQAYYVFGNYIDEVLMMNRSSADKFYLHDHLYSPVALLDSSGSVVERYEYDAYGKATIWNASFTTTCSVSQYNNPYLFTGREVNYFDDGNLPLQNNRIRYQNQYMGCWLTSDPLGINPAGGKHNPFKIDNQYTDGMNALEYVKSNPVIQVDPIGLVSQADCWATYNERRSKAIKNLASCTMDCLGLGGVGGNTVKCATGCVIAYVAGGSTTAYKTCLKACGACTTVIGTICEGWCFREFKNTHDSALEAYKKCSEKAED